MMNSFDRSNILNFLRAGVPLINGRQDNECVPDSVETFTPEVKKYGDDQLVVAGRLFFRRDRY